MVGPTLLPTPIVQHKPSPKQDNLISFSCTLAHFYERLSRNPINNRPDILIKEVDFTDVTIKPSARRHFLSKEMSSGDRVISVDLLFLLSFHRWRADYRDLLKLQQ